MKKKRTPFSETDYERAISHAHLPEFLEFEKLEESFLLAIDDLSQKTVLDLGAGYGRLIQVLSGAKGLYCIEIDPDLVRILEIKTKQYQNVHAVQLNFIEIDQYCLNSIADENLLAVAAQNTFGTIYEANLDSFLQALLRLKSSRKSVELIATFFKKEALSNLGIKLYTQISSLTGLPNLEKTNFEEGCFHSITGYFSKWWSDSEIDAIVGKLNGEVLRSTETIFFKTVHIKLL
jgi:predicted RNA methylase